MKLLIDNQLPLRLCTHLRAAGHDCVHVLEVGLGSATDAQIWQTAAAEKRVVSKDEDFVFLSGRAGDEGQIIWGRLGNCRNEALLAACDAVMEQVVAAIASGQRIVEIR